MKYEIVKCSPKAHCKILSFSDEHGIELRDENKKQKYPWHQIKIGESFAVPFSEANEASLRNCASKFSKKTGKKFAIIRHGEFNCFEAARIA